MAFNVLMFALRIVQAIHAVLILGLTIFVAHWYNADTLSHSPAQVNYIIFDTIWTLVALCYLTLAVVKPNMHHKWAVLAIDALSMVFWLSAFIAMSIFLTRLLFCRGSVCAAARAATVFSAFTWAAFTLSFAVAVKHAFFSQRVVKGGNRGFGELA
jgi:hypothetical protein